MKVLWISGVVCLLFSSCGRFGLCNDDTLSQPREHYTGNLKMNGYYYDDSSPEAPDRATLFMLYQDGTFYNYYSVATEDAANGRLTFNEEGRTRAKGNWGIFTVAGSNIKIEYWRPSTSCLPVITRKGVILSDTSFRITSWVISTKRNDVHAVDEVYVFRAFHPKPDSVVSFIR